jgi:glycosyltransferase involved in cell wall biosynthesis
VTQLSSSNTLVSIVVPSFNQGKFIAETIDSILKQDYRPIEILVIDGASTDKTLNVLESYKGIQELRWWSEPDNGVTDAVNKGLAKACGEIIGIQSSDDLYMPGAISAAVEFMKAHSDVALVFGDVELINERSEVIGRDIQTAFDLKHYLGRFAYIPQPSAFFRAEMFKEIGGWREEVSYAADADLWLRIAVRYKVARINRLMARYRYHPEQRDTQKSKIARDWEKAIRDLLASNNIDRSARRYARMGIFLAKYRYTPESDWMKRTRLLYRAAAANPKAVLNPSFPKREFIIGREPIWKFLSRVKRCLGFSPRGTVKH